MSTTEKSVPASVSVLRRAEVCDALNISVWTLDRWIKQGLFPSPIFLTPASSVAVWRVDDIANFLNKRKRARRHKQLRGAMKMKNRQQRLLRSPGGQFASRRARSSRP